MHQERLFRAAPSGYSVNAYYVVPEGWTVIIRRRRADEAWRDTEAICYSRLTTNELVDTMNAQAWVSLVDSSHLEPEL